MSELSDFVIQVSFGGKGIDKYLGNERKVTIPDDIRVLDRNAFEGHEEIEEVVFPEGLETIFPSAFKGCTSLKEVVFPGSIRHVGAQAFSNCTSLEKAEFNRLTKEYNDFTLIGNKAFENCISLREVNIPDIDYVYVYHIAGDAFAGCTSLADIRFDYRYAIIWGNDLNDICEPIKRTVIPFQLRKTELKRGLMSVAAKRILSGKANRDYEEEWTKYIKSQRNTCLKQIADDPVLNEFVVKKKLIEEEKLQEASSRKIVTIDIPYSEAKTKYTVTKRKNGYAIKDFCKDGRIRDLGNSYIFDPYKKDISKKIVIPDTIDGKPLAYVAVRSLPPDAVVICDAITFSKLSREVRASTSVAWLEDSAQFREDEAVKIRQFLKKETAAVAKALTESEKPEAYSRFVELCNPDRQFIEQLLELTKDNKEITAILLNAAGNFGEETVFDDIPKKKGSVSELKKKWNYEKSSVWTEDMKESLEGIRIRKYKGIGPEVEIPDVIGRTPVLSIGFSTFENCSGIVKVTVPASVIRIEKKAFFNCVDLKTVVILGTDVVVEKEAFSGCSSLNEVIFGSLPKFEVNVFRNSDGMFDDNGFVVFDTDDEKILVEAKLPYEKSEAVVPEGVTVIGSGAFAGWRGAFGAEEKYYKLRRIVLPSSVRTIGRAAFGGCVVLQDIVMPEGLEVIEDNAFYGCGILREAHIPSSVKEIGDYVFNENCAVCGYPGSAAEKYAAQNGIKFIPETNCNRNKEVLTDFDIVDGVLVNYLGEDSEVVIPAGITAIGERAFMENGTITSVIIPEGVTEIRDRAFDQCIALETVILPESLTAITGEYTFFLCRNLKKINMPRGLKEIGGYAFTHSGLEEITIPAGVEKIGKNAFEGCWELKINDLSGHLNTDGSEI